MKRSTNAFTQAPISKCMLAKFYPATNVELPKLHDVIDVVGIVTHTPADLDAASDQDTEGSAASFPPPSVLPRLQVLWHRALEPAARIPQTPGVAANPLDVRKLLHATLTAEAFAGDALAAEYFLLQLHSRVYARAGDRPLGKLSLNFTRWANTDAAQGAAAVLACASGACAYATGAKLTDLAKPDAPALAPKKDYETERLAQGGLQLPASTVFVVDETDVAEGLQFGDTGVKNLSALHTAAASANLAIDFTYYETQHALDIAVVAVSKGASLLRDAFDAVVPVEADANAAQAAAAVVAAAAPGAANAVRAAGSARARLATPHSQPRRRRRRRSRRRW